MEDDLRRIFTATQQTRIATRSATPAQISAKTSVVRPNMNVSSSFFSTSSEAYVTCVAVTPSTVMVAESSRRNAARIGGFRLHRDVETVRGRGAGGHGGGGISARLQGAETSAGLHRLGNRLGADGIGSAVDLVIDLDVGREETASTTRRRVLDELDDDIRRENAEICREAFLELGLEGGEVGVDGALRDGELDLRLDGELNVRDGDFSPRRRTPTAAATAA